CVEVPQVDEEQGHDVGAELDLDIGLGDLGHGRLGRLRGLEGPHVPQPLQRLLLEGGQGRVAQGGGPHLGKEGFRLGGGHKNDLRTAGLAPIDGVVPLQEALFFQGPQDVVGRPLADAQALGQGLVMDRQLGAPVHIQHAAQKLLAPLRQADVHNPPKNPRTNSSVRRAPPPRQWTCEKKNKGKSTLTPWIKGPGHRSYRRARARKSSSRTWYGMVLRAEGLGATKSMTPSTTGTGCTPHATGADRRSP